ncbi:MAG: DUF2817 domain-containing protein [Desulfobacter sp.]|nr:MAG: DUF2817 domain-containing protein [Desulfobacter sp.]
MKKRFNALFVLVIVAIAVVGSMLTFRYNTFTPKPVDTKIVSQDLVYFQESWEDCKTAFIQTARAAAEKYPDTQINALKLASPSQPGLTIDYCHIPAQKNPKRLLLLTSGIHGVEGFVGSAVQQMFMDQILDRVNLDETGILLIHGINPYGFKNRRRVTENNIDLNRNCSVDKALYESVNKGYTDLTPWLNPQKKVGLKSIPNLFFFVRALGQMASLRQAILQGQYQFETGIYFGGKHLDSPITAVTPLIREMAAPYDTIFCIDLHTGYGERGTLHLFPSPMEEGPVKQKIQTLFKGYSIDWGDDKDFYTVTGDFTAYVGAIMPEKTHLPMALEFGTLNSQTTFGAVRSLQNVILENQGTHFGYESEHERITVQTRFLEGYYPSSLAWRTQAIQDARMVLSQAVAVYSAMP